MFSNSSKYAIKAVLYLALNTDENIRVTTKDIAAPINVPQRYIAKLLQQLARQKVISSVKGPKGGFYLSEANKNQPLISIIVALNGEYKLNSCLLSLEDCNEDKPCPLHQLASPLKTKLMYNLKSKTIGEISLEIKEGISFLPL